ncbi:MAG: hypothetical protein L3J23_06405 [Flavobacteriaceae bacterium]|nr:hypothetical protein [Flavobacteriaceae bacterium]
MKVKIIYLLILLFTICCKQTKKGNKEISDSKLIETVANIENIPNPKEERNNNYNFDNVLKCEKYGYDGTASIADYGCLYEPKRNNTYGNIVFYLIPKKGIKKHLKKVDKLFEEGDKYDKWEKEGERINSMSITGIKNEFYIYLSLIDKKYLEHTPNLDASYNIKQNKGDNYKFKTELYTFNDKMQIWELLDSFETFQKISNKAWEWEQKKIKDIINKSN